MRRAREQVAKEKAARTNTDAYDDIHDPGQIPANRFQTIIADPPWKVDFPVPYPTMTTKAIEDMARHRPNCSNAKCRGCGILRAAHEQCHLYLWAVNGMIHDALHVMEAWDFKHVSTVTWIKTIKGGIEHDAQGMITWTRGDHSGQGIFRGTTEQLLIGVRGDLPFRKQSAYDTQFYAPRSGHSAKPDEQFYPLVQSMSLGPYLEVFARRLWKGFDAKKKDVAWGNQSPDKVR